MSPALCKVLFCRLAIGVGFELWVRVEMAAPAKRTWKNDATRGLGSIPDSAHVPLVTGRADALPAGTRQGTASRDECIHTHRGFA
jgi:hypothetical protein